MADQVNTGGGAGMGVLVGLLIAGLLVLAFFVFGGDIMDGDKDVNVKIETPAQQKSQ